MNFVIFILIALYVFGAELFVELSRKAREMPDKEGNEPSLKTVLLKLPRIIFSSVVAFGFVWPIAGVLSLIMITTGQYGVLMEYIREASASELLEHSEEN